MTRRILAFLFVFAGGAIVGRFAIPSMGTRLAGAGVVLAQSHKPVYALRLFTGPDNKTHAEKVELGFSPSGNGEASDLLPVNRAVLFRTTANSTHDFHVPPRRQYVITLSGHGEIDLEDGEKFVVGPGDIDLVEDTTGKGHITKVVGDGDRVALNLYIADQAGK